MGSCNSANAQAIIQKTSNEQSTSRSHITPGQVNHKAMAGSSMANPRSSMAKADVDKSCKTETANADEMSMLCSMSLQIEARDVIDTYKIASNGIICTVPQLMAVAKSSMLTRRASQMYPLEKPRAQVCGTEHWSSYACEPRAWRRLTYFYCLASYGWLPV